MAVTLSPILPRWGLLFFFQNCIHVISRLSIHFLLETHFPQMMVSGSKAGKEWKGRAKGSVEQGGGGGEDRDDNDSDDTGIIL